VAQGSSVQDTLSLTPSNGLSGTVALSEQVTNASGQSASGFSFSPSSFTLNGSSAQQLQASVQVGGTVPPGTYQVQVTASEGGASAKADFQVVVQDATASLSGFGASPNPAPNTGGKVTLSWSAQLATQYQLSVSPTLTLSPASFSSSVTSTQVTLPPNTTALPETYTFTLKADGQNAQVPVTEKTLGVTVDPVTVGKLSLSVSGVSGVSSSVLNGTDLSVTGQGYSDSVPLSSLPATLSGLTPGSYTVTAPGFQDSSQNTYLPTLSPTGEPAGNGSQVTVQVAAAASSSVAVSYATDTGQLNLVIDQVVSGQLLSSGYLHGFVPDLVAQSVNPVTGGNNSYRASQSGSVNLAAGTYSFSAAPVTDRYGDLYTAVPPAEVTLSAGGSQSVTVSYTTTTAQVVLDSQGAPRPAQLTLNGNTAAGGAQLVSAGTAGTSYTLNGTPILYQGVDFAAPSDQATVLPGSSTTLTAVYTPSPADLTGASVNTKNLPATGGGALLSWTGSNLSSVTISTVSSLGPTQIQTDAYPLSSQVLTFPPNTGSAPVIYQITVTPELLSGQSLSGSGLSSVSSSVTVWTAVTASTSSAGTPVSSLSFDGTGASYAQSLYPAESDYTGTFAASGCSGLLSLSVNSVLTNSVSTGSAFSLTPEQAGSCTLTIQDAYGDQLQLPVTVTTTSVSVN
jgi:hypothetical protein